MYKTGNAKMDAKIQAALKKDPLPKSRIAQMHENMAMGEERDNKYNVAQKSDRTYKGISFASKHEMERYQMLELLEKAGKITELQIQVEFNLMQGFVHPQHGRVNAIAYVADFVYRQLEGDYYNRIVVEDAKGYQTDEYKLKRKLFLKRYPEYIFLET